MILFTTFLFIYPVYQLNIVARAGILLKAAYVYQIVDIHNMWFHRTIVMDSCRNQMLRIIESRN